MVKRKRTQAQTMIYYKLDRKLKIEQHALNYNPGLNSGTPEGLTHFDLLVCAVRVW
jgi:hypothetical protein